VAKTTVELPERLHRKLRVKAALDGRSMNELLVEAVEASLQDFRVQPEMLEVESVPRERTRR
jgi:plasmid stability protein